MHGKETAALDTFGDIFNGHAAGIYFPDEGQIFIFNIKGVTENCTDINLTVTVVGNSSVVIEKLPVGTYSVTELEKWSYRYTPDSVERNISLAISPDTNIVTFSHVRSVTKWLDGNSNEKNNYN